MIIQKKIEVQNRIIPSSITFVLNSMTVPTAVLDAFEVWSSFQNVSASTPTPPHFNNENLLRRTLAAAAGVIGTTEGEFSELLADVAAVDASDP